MIDTEPPPFDLCGPLPQGVTILEASAGTGKTYAIAALATRYVAEGTPLGEVLIVTFTNLATAELRVRVRERLVGARDAIEAALAGEEPPSDEVLCLLTDAPADELHLRRRRLVQALAEFDAATITTIHGFCQEVLKSLGVAGDIDRAFTFTENARQIVDETIDDLYVAQFVGSDEDPPFPLRQAREVARDAVENPSTRLVPDGQPEGTPAALRYALADGARIEVDRRMRATATMTFDDLLTRLRAAVTDTASGDRIAERLRGEFRVALIDEFQDTDPDQWEILRAAFAHPGATMVLIGDPKQAIYAFRGADVYAYLKARRIADGQYTLRINRRSDQGLLDAYDALFGRTRLGHPAIEYRQVEAPPAHRQSRLSGAPDDASLRVRLVSRTADGMRVAPRSGCAEPNTARMYVARDVAADIAALLDSQAQIERHGSGGETLGQDRVGAGDIAVLVRKNSHAGLVQQALQAVGVPAVVNGAGSVFATDSARAWRRLLEVLERPSSLRRVRAVALTSFVGWSAERVAGASDAEWNELQTRLYGWAGVLARSGVATLFEVIAAQMALTVRVLGTTGGERRLTDLRHVGELLHTAAVENRLGITALLAWLRRRCASDDRDPNADDRARRLESDADAVQVLTIHRSKGLEFPIVYCPYLWDPVWIPSTPEPVTFHDPDYDEQRTLDVALDRQLPSYRMHEARAKREQLDEELRLAYVALTRARHQAVVWWAGTYFSRDSSLGRLVFERDEDGHVVSQGSFTPTDDRAWERFTALAATAPAGAMSVQVADPNNDVRWHPPHAAPVRLTAAETTRYADVHWRRTSFSMIVAGRNEAQVASEREEAAGADDLPLDRPLRGAQADDPLAAWTDLPSLLSDLPAGTRTGTFVHRVLERVNFAAADLSAELDTVVAEQALRRRLNLGDRAQLSAGLGAAIDTPLGPLAGGRRLRDLQSTDCLDELAFELPLVGGDQPTGDVTLAAIAGVLREHVPVGDPLHGYAERIADPALRGRLRGYLSGTIDMLARLDPATGAAPFAIIDYKTNRLAPSTEPLTAWHYRPEALVAEMQHRHYALQALLYAVAIHRFLRWRVPDAGAATHNPAIFYLFLRGMSGAEAPVAPDGAPAGVFAWWPPTGLVSALSNLFDEGASS
jgi:exodeoxyribonuclease V beta subunit